MLEMFTHLKLYKPFLCKFGSLLPVETEIDLMPGTCLHTWQAGIAAACFWSVYLPTFLHRCKSGSAFRSRRKTSNPWLLHVTGRDEGHDATHSASTALLRLCSHLWLFQAFWLQMLDSHLGGTPILWIQTIESLAFLYICLVLVTKTTTYLHKFDFANQNQHPPPNHHHPPMTPLTFKVNFGQFR